jgi:hypothetical protein
MASPLVGIGLRISPQMVFPLPREREAKGAVLTVSTLFWRLGP